MIACDSDVNECRHNAEEQVIEQAVDGPLAPVHDPQHLAGLTPKVPP